MPLRDNQGRTFHYLRLSLTNACNFRCFYCLPNGYKFRPEDRNLISVSEIRRLVTAFSEMGFWKIRLTGGEPTIRPDFVEIAETVAQTPGVETVALSTNGFRLKEFARRYRTAGISALNVSVDSLDPERFCKITGRNKLRDVLSGIERALDLGYRKVKVNTVLLKEHTVHDLHRFLDWARELSVSVRFIELMPTGDNRELFRTQHLRATTIQEWLIREGWRMAPFQLGAGPAREWVHENSLGSIGLITPYDQHFCESCNRLRVTSQGGLRLCLFGESEHSLRPLLQHDDQVTELKETVQRLLGIKEASHDLHAGRFGNIPHFAALGG